jgi:hypothetical protein
MNARQLWSSINNNHCRTQMLPTRSQWTKLMCQFPPSLLPTRACRSTHVPSQPTHMPCWSTLPSQRAGFFCGKRYTEATRTRPLYSDAGPCSCILNRYGENWGMPLCCQIAHIVRQMRQHGQNSLITVRNSWTYFEPGAAYQRRSAPK